MRAMTAAPITAALLRLRRRLWPHGDEHGWMPIGVLVYLGFLLLPLLFFAWLPRRAYGVAIGHGHIVAATLASIAVFLPIHVWYFRDPLRRALPTAVLATVLALLLLPFNPFANTYVIYAASYLSAWRRRLWQALLAVVVILAAYAWVTWRVRQPMFIVPLTTLVAAGAFFSSYFYAQKRERDAALLLSHEEVRRVAAYAERERIGRDLHDLLGHTLSTVALKAELAGKLVERDAQAARREIDDVAGIAREALAQVRTAVSGIRSALIAAEVASAKVLLEAGGVRLQADIDEVAMPPAVESALAMSLREAATNIARHAQAGNARIRLQRIGDAVQLQVADDGRGGGIVTGHGLAGMRERIEALGGSVTIDGGRGTTLVARLPLGQAA